MLPDARAALYDEDALSCLREIGSAGQTVMTGPNDDHVPGFGGERANGHRQTDLAQNSGRR